MIFIQSKMGIKNHFINHRLILDSFLNNESKFISIQKGADLMLNSIKNGGTIFSCGNGGSMCDAMHFAQELSGYFNKKRKALPAICISDSSHITCVANDTSFDFVFSRYLEANGKRGDCLLAISTSGNSINVINAAKEAQKKNMKVISLSSNSGGELSKYTDVSICVSSKSTDSIQEMHITIIHSIISYIEEKLNL